MAQVSVGEVGHHDAAVRGAAVGHEFVAVRVADDIPTLAELLHETDAGPLMTAHTASC
ncbi:hypothetical protein [Streptomyces flaveolus]|uniref:hypothetical protein n=1 Tax=Streptomyces flaveolus TaxID=67297 RepID=UPI00166F6ECB|nr:hypothetical protein [Streptomyces flaveolus]